MTKPTVATTYDDDILIWSEEQSGLLRRAAAGERFNDVGPDWENIIEEIESVGSDQLSAVETLLLQALVHLLKADAWPLARDVDHWREEARNFWAQASLRFAPSMRQRTGIAKIYRKALRVLPDANHDQPALPFAADLPVTLDELLADD